MYKLNYGDDVYKDKLTEAAYRVCRLAATERPFTGIYNDHWLDGEYLCACCDIELFDSKHKFNAGCGWPSFYQTLGDNVVVNFTPTEAEEKDLPQLLQKTLNAIEKAKKAAGKSDQDVLFSRLRWSYPFVLKAKQSVAGIIS